jgi:hypothetical protein
MQDARRHQPAAKLHRWLAGGRVTLEFLECPGLVDRRRYEDICRVRHGSTVAT